MKSDFLFNTNEYDDCRVISPSPFAKWQKHVDEQMRDGIITRYSCISNPYEIMDDASAIIVVMKKYSPYNIDNWDKDSLIIDPYYVASNELYHINNRLINKIKNMGYKAKSASSLPLKHAALRAGYGQCGRLGLLIHPMHGTMVTFNGIITDMPLTITHDYSGDILNCYDCKMCQKACPTNALVDSGILQRSICLRDSMPIDYRIDDSIKEMISNKYIGCDICQRVCPYNKGISFVDPPKRLVEATNLFTLLDIKNEKSIHNHKVIREYIGKNYTSRNKMLSACVTHAGIIGDEKYIPLLDSIINDDISNEITNSAIWAIKQINL